MTALAGFWARGSSLDAARACERMLAGQALYAPDAPAIRRSGDFAIGRRLFSLLPEDALDRGPRVGGGWILVADARLDNRDELAEALGIDAAEARRLPESALILRAVERWEEEAAERLIGDFAFAAWDEHRQRLLMARDFSGQRPLHFHEGDGFFAFASMPKGLHALAEIPRAPKLEAVKQGLALIPEPGSGTLFEGIQRVPPGHVAIVTGGGVALRPYWRPSRRLLRLKRPEDYHDAVREALDRAVSARLRGASGRVATHLSGGLDSSAVAATAARMLAPGGKVTAFTSVPRKGFGDGSRYGRFCDEGPHAAAVAALYPNLEHILIRTAGCSPLDALDRNTLLYEQPVLNPCNSVWGDAILDATKQRGLKVLLTGQSGNASFSFSGFDRLADLLARGRLLALGREALALRRRGIRLRSAIAHAAGPFLPARLWFAIAARAGRPLDIASYSLLDGAAAAGFRDAVAARLRPSRDSFATRLRMIAPVDPGNYNKGMLAGWGVDSRDPTGDRRLMELCLAIPPDQYLRNGETRALARGAFADRLPAIIVSETRKGLQAADWHEGLCAARRDVADEVERIAGLAAAEGIFDTPRMKRLIADWPEAGWTDWNVQSAYRLALLRGIALGHFLRRAVGAN